MHHAPDALAPLAPTQISLASPARRPATRPASPTLLAESLAWLAGAAAFAVTVMLAASLLAVLD